MPAILIDGRPVRTPISGVARYCLSLTNALAIDPPAGIGIPDVLVQRDGGANSCPDEFSATVRQIEYRPLRTRRKWQNVAFEFLPRLVARRALGGYDLVHETYFANIGTRPGQRKVATIHDVIPLDHPKYFNRNNRVFARRNFHRQVREAAVIVAVSQFTRQRIIELGDVDPDKISVIGCGVDLPSRALIESATWPIGGQIERGTRYGLYVGNLEPRKNLDRFIDAWAALGASHEDARLVVAGRLNYQAEQTIARGRAVLGDRFMYLGPVSEADKWALMTHASFLTLPSLYEGYGIPIVEAYACGTPAIFARNSSMTELAADDRQMFDGLSTDDMTAAIRRVLDREEWVADVVKDRTAWVERNRWADVARDVAGVYRAVLGR